MKYRPSKTEAYIAERIHKAQRIRAISEITLESRLKELTPMQVQQYQSGQIPVLASGLWDIANAIEMPIHYFFPSYDKEGIRPIYTDIEIETIEKLRSLSFEQLLAISVFIIKFTRTD